MDGLSHPRAALVLVCTSSILPPSLRASSQSLRPVPHLRLRTAPPSPRICACRTCALYIPPRPTRSPPSHLISMDPVGGSSSASMNIKKQEDMDGMGPKSDQKAEQKPVVRTLNRVPRKYIMLHSIPEPSIGPYSP